MIFRLLISLFLLASALHHNAQNFVESSGEAGISIVPEAASYMGGGMAWFDYNNDGYDDLYVTGCTLQDKLFQNNQDGTFSDVTMAAGLGATAQVNTVAVATGDIDNDGDRDILLATWKFTSSSDFAPNMLFLNNGDGTFSEIGESAGLSGAAFSMSVGFADVNLDGFLDIHVGNYIESMDFIMENGQVVGFNHDCFPDLLYINNGDNTFSEMSEVYGLNNEGCTLAVTASDYDLDGDPDFMVANDFGEFIIPDRLYRNDYPLQHFTDVSLASGADIGMYAMGIAVGDYDEDQDLDYFVTNLGKNALLNQESGIFQNEIEGSGAENASSENLFYTSWGTFFLDADNDSYLDLFVANGHIPSVPLTANHVWDPNQLYRYNFDGTFTNIAEAAGVADTNIARGTSFSDFDRDGDLDVGVVNILNEVLLGNEHFMLYENQGSGNHWIEFHLQGTTCNRDAFGSIVKLFSGDRVLLREYSGTGGSHCSQHGTQVHFGLGDIAAVDSVQVLWPGGQVQSIVDPAIDSIHEVEQEVIETTAEWTRPAPRVYPNPVSGLLAIHGLPGTISQTEVVIYDSYGREILRHDQAIVENGNVFVKLPAQLSGGIYQLQISGDQYFYKTTIVVQ